MKISRISLCVSGWYRSPQYRSPSITFISQYGILFGNIQNLRTNLSILSTLCNDLRFHASEISTTKLFTVTGLQEEDVRCNYKKYRNPLEGAKLKLKRCNLTFDPVDGRF